MMTSLLQSVPSKWTLFRLSVLAYVVKRLRSRFADSNRASAARSRLAHLHPDPLARVTIIGGGFSGVCQAIKLKRAGIPFRILEKERDFGGTWFLNTYPGCQCDVPAHLYSFSFALNPDWEQPYASSAQICAYIHAVCREYGLYEHVTFNQKVVRCEWKEADRVWHISTIDTISGEKALFVSRFAVGGFGALHVPSYPSIDRSAFKGQQMHSAEWDSSINLKGKKVVVVGSAASAIQIVPQICDDVERVTILQRTPNWVVPQKNPSLPPDLTYGPKLKFLFRNFPWLMRLHRYGIYAVQESFFFLGFFDSPDNNRFMKRYANANRNLVAKVMKMQLGGDEELAKKVIPTFPIGCKRVLKSEVYLKSLTKTNVDVVTSGAERIDSNCVVLQDGSSIEADVIIYATGFKVGSMGDMTLTNGIDTYKNTDCVDQAVGSYLGIVTRGMPNYFLMLGPNTGLGHNSIILHTEAQASYVTKVLTQALDAGATRVEIKESVQTRFMKWVWSEMEKRVWVGHCKSWYQNADGLVPTLWPSSTVKYISMASNPTLENFEVELSGDGLAAKM